MITRIHGKIVFECDACGEVFDTEIDDFPTALILLRGEQWISRKALEEDDWSHYCPTCVGELAQRQHQ